MAKNGFKVLDSDMHIIEPPDLWQRYPQPYVQGILGHEDAGMTQMYVAWMALEEEEAIEALRDFDTWA